MNTFKNMLSILKDRGPVDPEEVKRRAAKFQAEQGTAQMAEEKGLEDADYTPGGLEDFVSPKGLMSKIGKGAAAAKEATRYIEKTMKDGTILVYEIPDKVYATIKSFDVNTLKPYLKDIINSSVKAGGNALPSSKTGASLGWDKGTQVMAPSKGKN